MQFKIRPIDPTLDWNFFHNLHVLSDETRRAIEPLEEESATRLWEEIVSAEPEVWHPDLLPSDHWIRNVKRFGPYWTFPWDKKSGRDFIVGFLRSHLEWPEHLRVFFIQNKKRAVKTDWKTFLGTWRNFLFVDENPFVISLKRPEFVMFVEDANVAIGDRI